jgi:putative ATPase
LDISDVVTTSHRLKGGPERNSFVWQKQEFPFKILTMSDLFTAGEKIAIEKNQPLAARFRPRNLDEYIGQSHLLALGKPLRRLIESDRITSLIFFGPPGTGKTSLAELIAQRTESHFERLNAVEASVQQVRTTIAQAVQRLRHHQKKTILFVDELHRFSKSQQDVLLPDVEQGTIRLIGATTHNPSFFITGPLVSRSQVFQLEPLSTESLETLVDRVLLDSERGLGTFQLEIDPEAKRHLIQTAEGDARRLLNALEVAALTTSPVANGKTQITREIIEACVQRKLVLYDRDEDQHYDTISAFIKSVRGSDPDAALYWLAKMIEAGEDPRFIARRIVILAAEDIGLADPHALPLAVAAQQAVEFIGMPEGRIILSEATLYLATAAKSNAAYVAIDAALAHVRTHPTLEVPRKLRSTGGTSSKILGNGKGYEYSHDAEEGVSSHDFGVKGVTFYKPTVKGYEKTISERLNRWKEIQAERQKNAGGTSSASPT